MKIIVAIIAVTIFTLGCEENKETLENTAKISNDETITQEAENEEHNTQTEDVESIIASIDSHRIIVENEIDNPLEITSDALREKTKQKWGKIHFYVKDGAVVRIKTYPHETVSERTEEFYLMDNQLVLAVIEDHGLGERGKEQEEIDKLYYFDNEEVIKEISSDKESEFGVKNSDGEELLSEVKEYLKVYEENLKEKSEE